MEEKKYPKAIVGGLIYNSRGELFLMQSSGKYQDQWIVPRGKLGGCYETHVRISL